MGGSVLHVLNSDSEPPRTDRRLRIAMVGFCALLLFTIVASVHLSTLDISYGTLVFGPTTLWRNHDASFRVAAFDPRGVDLVGPMRVRGTLRDTAGNLTAVEAHGARDAILRLLVPDTANPTCELALDIETPLGTDSLRVPLSAGDEPAPLVGRVSHSSEVLHPQAPRPKGSYQIALYPAAGHVVAGLENSIAGIITKEGLPVKTGLDTNTFGIHTESDTLGLFRFAYQPTPTPEPLSFTLSADPKTRLELPIDARPTGLLVAASPNVFLAPGDTVSVEIRTLPFRGPVHIDVWAAGTLLLAMSDYPENGMLSFEVALSDSIRGFVRIEAYRNLVAAEGNASGVLLWVSALARAEAASDALAALSALPGGDPVIERARAATGDARVHLTALALSRYVPPLRGAPLVASSLDSRRDLVSTEKARLRSRVHVLFVLTVTLGLSTLVVWALRSQRRMQRDMRRVADEALAAGEEIDTQGVERAARFGHTSELFLALAAIVLVAYGIYALLTSMRWE